MTDIDRLSHELRQPLHPDRIKKHPHNRQLYLESGDVIRELNAVFGPLGWSDRKVDLQLVSQDQCQIGKGDRQTDGWAVVYTCVWEIAVHEPGAPSLPLRTVQGVGSGAGYAGQVGDAHDSAAKSAESDAIKRAARKLGNRFGQVLYLWNPDDQKLSEPQARRWWAEMGWVGEPVPYAGEPAPAVPAPSAAPGEATAPSWYGASGVEDRQAAALECISWVLAHLGGDPEAAGPVLELHPDMVFAATAMEQPDAPATLDQRGDLLSYVRDATRGPGPEPTNAQIGQMVAAWVGRPLSAAAPLTQAELARAVIGCWTSYGPGRTVAGLTACVDRALEGVEP